MPFHKEPCPPFQSSGSSSGNTEAALANSSATPGYAARIAAVRRAVLGMELDDTLYSVLRGVDPAAAAEVAETATAKAQLLASKEAAQFAQQVASGLVAAELGGHPGQSA